MLNKTLGADRRISIGSHRFPPAAAIAQHSFPASVQEMNALENLPVLEVGERFEVKDNGPAAKAAKQTNPLR